MKILVTGGAGFIGSNFIRYWLKKHPEDKVNNLDKLTYAGHLSSTEDFVDNLNYKFIKGDICDPDIVDLAMEGTDIVVHFAAESHVDRSVIDPLTFAKTNFVGTAILLNTALKHQVKRFHHVSTDEVYGQLKKDEPAFSEKTPYAPRTPYSASKAGSDHLVRAYFETYGFPVTITNCSNNYGPYQDPEKLIPRFITNLLQDKKIPLMGKGENVRDWLFVEDHCRAIDLVLQKGEIGQTYCVGGQEATNMEITKRLLELLGKDESYIEYVPDRLGHDFRYAIDPSRIEGLGWEPLHDLDEWLEKTVAWYKENREWWGVLLKENRPVVDRVAQKRYITN